MAFRQNTFDPIADPSPFFVDEAYFRLKEMKQVHDWELKSGQLKKPNLQYFIREGLSKAFKEVELEIDFDFPKDAKGLKTTPEFLTIMERYAPGFIAKHNQSMKTDDFRPMIEFLYPLSSVYQDQLKKKEQQQQSKGFFAKLFA